MARPTATSRTSVVCRAISVVGLVALYSDALLRVIGKLLAVRDPVAASAPPHSTPLQRLVGEAGQQLPPPPPPLEWTAAAQRREDAAVQAAAAGAASLEQELGTAPAETGVEEAIADEDEGGCGAHRLLYGNMDADLAPWHALGLRLTAAEMSRQVEHVRLHRGKWNSWVSDTMTPILIRDGKIYLSLGPPLKDPTNYFWTVLRDLQARARARARAPPRGRALALAQAPAPAPAPAPALAPALAAAAAAAAARRTAPDGTASSPGAGASHAAAGHRVPPQHGGHACGGGDAIGQALGARARALLLQARRLPRPARARLLLA